jgi:hypothetical protein
MHSVIIWIAESSASEEINDDLGIKNTILKPALFFPRTLLLKLKVPSDNSLLLKEVLTYPGIKLGKINLE